MELLASKRVHCIETSHRLCNLYEWSPYHRTIPESIELPITARSVHVSTTSSMVPCHCVSSPSIPQSSATSLLTSTTLITSLTRSTWRVSHDIPLSRSSYISNPPGVVYPTPKHKSSSRSPWQNYFGPEQLDSSLRWYLSTGGVANNHSTGSLGLCRGEVRGAWQ